METHRKRFAPPPGLTANLNLSSTPRIIAALSAFNHYHYLDTNILHAIADAPNSLHGFRGVCEDLYRARLVTRRTMNGNTNYAQTMTYSRTDAGFKYLTIKGHPVADDHNAAQPEEQFNIDLADAFIEIGTRKHGVDFHRWFDVKQNSNDLPSAPFRFPYQAGLETFNLNPDGKPFSLKKGNVTVLCLKEIVRWNKDQKTIKNKLRTYHQILPAIKQRYNVKNVVVLWISTDDTDTTQNNILKWVSEVAKETSDTLRGWHLVHRMPDYIRNPVSTIPISTDLVDTPFQRAGAYPFSLATLDEVK
jgi:hypothetical protein